MIAVNGMKASASPQKFIGIDSMGRTSMYTQKESLHPYCFKGSMRPNYDSVSVNSTIALLKKNISGFHNNRLLTWQFIKGLQMQPRVWQDVINQRMDGMTP
jgi:phospho-2-dehydro-3-deoxyheptonate aldolase